MARLVRDYATQVLGAAEVTRIVRASKGRVPPAPLRLELEARHALEAPDDGARPWDGAPAPQVAREETAWASDAPDYDPGAAGAEYSPGSNGDAT